MVEVERSDLVARVVPAAAGSACLLDARGAGMAVNDPQALLTH